MPYVSPAAVVSGAVISKTTFGDVVKADLDYLANPPACRVYRSGTQSIPNTTRTAVTFDSERYDTNNMHSTSVNTNRITVNTAGLYMISGHVGFSTSTVGFRIAYIIVNGTLQIAIQSTNVRTDGFLDMSVATTWKAAVNDYFTLEVYQSSGGAQLLGQASATDAFASEFAATWIGLG